MCKIRKTSTLEYVCRADEIPWLVGLLSWNENHDGMADPAECFLAGDECAASTNLQIIEEVKEVEK